MDVMRYLEADIYRIKTKSTAQVSISLILGSFGSFALFWDIFYFLLFSPLWTDMFMLYNSELPYLTE